MTPLYLRFAAFGPYREPQEVDFAALSDAGLFLIRGETGAGKTVILDAITYALYGVSSGGGRGDLTAMRCQYALPEEATEIVFDFRSKERKFRFVRRLRARRKRNGEVEYLTEQDAFFANEQEEWESFFENPTQKRVEEKAMQLLRLTAEQFRQVVILPQGQFERLLVAGSEEKEGLLTTLFGTEKWGIAADILTERMNAQRRELESGNEALSARLSAIGCDTESDLAEQLQESAAAIAVTQKRFAMLSREAETAEKELLRATLTEQQFAQLIEARRSIQTLEARALDMEMKRKLLRLREIAEPYRAWQEAVVNARRAKEDLAFSEQAERDAAAARGKLTARLKKQDTLCKELQGMAERLPVLESELRLQDARMRMWEQSRATESKYKERIKALELLETSYQLRVAEMARASALHLRQLSAELAATLAEGQPCPVCGSIHHPEPALEADETMTREMLAACTKELEQAQMAVFSCRAEVGSLADRLRHESEQLEKEGGYDAAAHRKTAEDAQRAEAAAKQLKIAEAERRQLVEKDQQLQLKENTIQQSRINGRLRFEQFSAVASMREEQLEKLDPVGDARVALSGELPDGDGFTQLEQELSLFESRLAAARETEQKLMDSTAQVERPDIAALKKALADRQQEKMAENSRLALAQQRQEVLSAAQTELVAQRQALNQRTEEFERFAAFVKTVRGTNGVSLQRYVLGAMLSAVTVEANRLLAGVHEGRYQIYRTLESTGRTRKAGLELEVFDRQSGGRRPVTTLSGGEKFLVALALSIGLSAVTQARAGGTRLGAIFIDEGFGTLDEASLQDALRVLFAIRDSRGTVGIISHVALLREAIPAGIRVEKTRDGSKLVVTT